ncbi:MAG: helix-turn-helix transcriptional regulator [Bacteroidetes bacterium]|nr:helix-turn-helix transcriptional regulator [Bacteroidota bacterium]
MYNLSIKNMVCARCVKVVRDELTGLGLNITEVNLGNVTLDKKPSASQLTKISNVLEQNGFELLDEKGAKTIEQIKNLIIESVHYNKGDKKETENFSSYISKKLNLDYNYLSSLFSSIEGITIEKFTILQKIEKVKELLVYDELSLGEIAFNLGYSSVQHLSNQFKSVTGITPSQFKQTHSKSLSARKPLDKIS